MATRDGRIAGHPSSVVERPSTPIGEAQVDAAVIPWNLQGHCEDFVLRKCNARPWRFEAGLGP